MPICFLPRYIRTFYVLPSICLDRPGLIMTASCSSVVRPLEHFQVKYTLRNNLQDFLAVHLIWDTEGVLTISTYRTQTRFIIQALTNLI